MKGMKKLMRNDDFYNNYKPLVPYMPVEPRVGYGYVPYQVNPEYFNDLNEIFINGTIFPALVTPYLEYIKRGV